MASLLLHSAYVPSVPVWEALAWGDTPLEAEQGRILHNLNYDPTEPSAVCWSGIDSDQNYTGREKQKKCRDRLN